jgi:hypothetical protein
MLLNNITVLSAYPTEFIQIDLNNAAPPELNVRLGLRFRSTYWGDNENILNFSNLSVNQAGAEPFVYNNPTLAAANNLAEISRYVQPTNFANIPSDFPVFFASSAIPYNDLLISFRAGASAISVFPSRPYPLITKTSQNSFTVSGAFFNATALDYAITHSDYKKIFNESSLSVLSQKGAFINFQSSFKSAHKRDYVLYNNNDNNSVGIVINRSPMPANEPYDTHIIPESFCLTLPVSASSEAFTRQHYLSYINTTNGVAVLSSLTSNTSIASAILYDELGQLSIVLPTGYKLPKGADIVVSYETSAFVPVTTVNTSTNTYAITSTSVSPYLLNYNFTVTPTATNVTSNAFNIFFSPSALFLNSGSSSAVSLSTVMVDNFYQTFFPIVSSDVVVKFSESVSPTSLSAIDARTQTVYTANTWIPASANLLFVNDGFVNQYTLNLTYSATNNSIWQYTLPSFYLNSDKILMGLQILSSTEFSAQVIAWSFPYTISSSQQVKWTINPSENLTVVNSVGSAIPLDVLTDLGEGQLFINNLGVNDTQISLEIPAFGSNYNIYTTWYPTSASFIGASLVLSASPINDYNEIKTSSISALMQKRNMLYVVPYTGIISWEETINSGESTFYDSSSGSTIYEGMIYPSVRSNDIINSTFTTSNAYSNPQNVTFNIHSVFIHPNVGTLHADIQFNARQYPAYKPLLFASLSSLSGVYLNSGITTGYTFTNSDVITAVAVLSAFANVPLENIRWNLPDSSVVSGISAVFPLNSSFCLSVSALSAKPNGGGFEYYNFVDTICLYYNPNAVNLNYISFPERMYFPEKILTTTNYTESLGLTALANCGPQNIVLSTFGGFTDYHYKIGSKTIRSTSNIIAFPVTYNDVSASNIVSISAFGPGYPINNPLTVYNTASSDNSSIYKQTIAFNTIPNISPVLVVDDDVIDLDLLADTYFTPSISYETSGIIVAGGNYVYVLSSSNSVRVDTTVHDINETSDMFQFTSDINNFFSISADTFNVFNLYISGFLVKTPNQICAFTQPFSSNMVSLSVYYSNIDLAIFTPQNINNSNSIIYFSNESTNLLPIPPNYFVFGDGAGHTQATYSVLSTLTGLYISEGTYSPYLCAVFDEGISYKKWDNFIIIKNNYIDYEEQVTRQFPAALELPFSCSEFTIAPNSWQTASVLNDTFDKINTNFIYLSAMTKTFNITFPKNLLGFWAITTNGQQQWFYNEEATIAPYQNYKHATLIDNRFLLINNDTLELRNYDFNMSLIKLFTHINEGEKFITPSHVVYNATLNKIIVLDSNQKLIFIFSFDNDELKYTHYWGGAGEKDSRTKLNKPIDLHIDHRDFIFITDKDSLNIKCYNTYLNWVFNITHSEWSSTNAPISVTSSSSHIFVLTSNNIVYKFSDSEYDSQFTVNGGIHIAYDLNHNGLIYIFDQSITVYGENGTFINSFANYNNIKELLFIDDEVFGVTSNVIFKFINYVDYFTILDTNHLNYMWGLSSIFVDPSEAVTDFVLNDSFKKLHDNMMLFSKDINRKYIVYQDEYGEFIRQEARNIVSTERLLSASYFEPIGLNEIVSYDVLARTYNNICYDMSLLKDMIDVQYEQLPLSGICWSWKYHKISATQQINNNTRPYSWIELRSNDIFLPEVSAITWKDAYKCCGPFNPMPICWIWEELSCDCIFPRTWKQSECSTNFVDTWASKENNCCLKPDYYFDNCTESC